MFWDASKRVPRLKVLKSNPDSVKNDKIVVGIPQLVSAQASVAEKNSASVGVQALGSSIAGSIHSLIETPIVTPIEAAITQTQINGRAFLVNLATLWEQKALFRALPAALTGAIPKACVHYRCTQ